LLVLLLLLLLAPPPLPPPLNLQAALNGTGLPAIIMSLKSKAKAKAKEDSFNKNLGHKIQSDFFPCAILP
jgi:hypothetical protein